MPHPEPVNSYKLMGQHRHQLSGWFHLARWRKINLQVVLGRDPGRLGSRLDGMGGLREATPIGNPAQDGFKQNH